ncbi:MAG TPA: HD-GYP domain-containing protein [Spirochaetota bacterium]|nr:HD-GYP domain-containing protein [Spirochaetota bacterium]HOL56448.1 HD-GYP domain-containing protein [Spirochaetota bacterium]HPP04464.1 HD-GYP domain-containing protein [Spirochaetota bacterium]
MGSFDILREKVNQYLKTNNFPGLSGDFNNPEELFKNSLKSIFKIEKNNKQRDFFAHEISAMFTQYLGGGATQRLLNQYMEEISEEFPPDEDFVDYYNYCLSAYEDFLDKFINKNVIDNETLENIIKKIFLIIKKAKNNVISHMALNTENYNFNIYHGINTTILALICGETMKLTDRQMRELAYVGLLHDIGMLKISEEILNKEDKLTEEEYNKIKTHPIIAYKLLNEKNIFGRDVLDPIIQHHEQFDGNGYPRKISKDKIHIYAKIIAIADAFEAQIAVRAYRKSKSGYSAMKEVLADAQNRFDPIVLRAFLQSLSIYPPGTIVQLNNNAIGTVTNVNPNAPLRPELKIIIDEFGEKPTKLTIIDLKNEPSLFIVRVLNKDDYFNK